MFALHICKPILHSLKYLQGLHSQIRACENERLNCFFLLWNFHPTPLLEDHQRICVLQTKIN